MTSKQWYSASIFSKNDSPDRLEDENIWEEVIVLIYADSVGDAMRQVQSIGRSSEHQFVSATGERCYWIFERVERIVEIGEVLSSGIELFSRFLKASEAKSLLLPFSE